MELDEEVSHFKLEVTRRLHALPSGKIQWKQCPFSQCLWL
jgi:hypothetical protein